MHKFFKGGYLSGYRTYIISGIGILSAFGAYMVGDVDIFDMLQTIFPLAAIYFLRQSVNDNKGDRNGHSKKISK